MAAWLDSPVQHGPVQHGPVQHGHGPGARLDAAISVTGTKTIEYGGYVIAVPAAWPVYELAARPHLCVRYDRHAVYLGRPGPDQHCPAHLVGRTESVRIDGAAAGAAVIYQRGTGAAQRWPVRRWPARRRPTQSRIVRDTVDRELGLIIARPSLSVTATYANDPAMAERMHRQRARLPPGTRRPRAPRTALHARRAGPAKRHGGAGAPHPRQGLGTCPGAGPRRRTVHRPMAGFDTCTAPSIGAMRAWRPFYQAVAIYIGGMNMACAQGNLSARWVRQVKAMGWHLIPTYVGLQPPCDRFGGKIRRRHAAREGAAAAADAVARARELRLRRHAPIYFDMEGYNSNRKRCRRAVLTFLDAWTRRVRGLGYTSGVYSSAGSGAQDLGAARSVGGHRLARPETIWFALWDGHRNLRAAPYLLASWWPADRRIKQFRGSHWQRHGRFRLDIDRDEVFGAVY